MRSSAIAGCGFANMSRAVRRALSTGADAAAARLSGSRWERLKNGKAGVWCRSLLSDYREACRDMVVGARERPLKASLYAVALGGGWFCFHSQPGQSEFQAALVERSNQLGLLSPWTRSAASDAHVQNLVKLQSQGRLRLLSLGLLSVVYGVDHDPDTTLYEAQCSSLSAPWREIPHRVLDVGFCWRWWVLESKMKDYDVNEEEFRHLPADMQRTSPPGLQGVQRNESLHRQSWLPLPVGAQEE
ncbi:mitochondrial import inner membrane translocase subunit Tim29 [Oryzias latipes]|uniref:mitochondrial import inner membrane translocase subunit Tim29 n=1 Tax=Oryzias latipes TaxID=8090 RepID=UPI0002A4B217|nr:mitochondrial import inner membrane translocase subunit Tim29 [Oryzias latipes]